MAKTKLTIEEVLSNLPKDELLLVKKLRSLIAECLPKATEKIYYGGAPFYTRNRMICFIWPPSVYWGSKQNGEKHKQKGVTLGFCQGNRMANEDHSLLAEGRKQVYCLYFKRLADINEDQIRALLFEAEMIDDSFAKSKK